MDSLSRLDELAQIAAEQALDILGMDHIELVEDVRLVELGPVNANSIDPLRVTWRVDYDDVNSFPISMLLLAEHLEDEEALVLSMAAWILHSIRGTDGADGAQA